MNVPALRSSLVPAVTSEGSAPAYRYDRSHLYILNGVKHIYAESQGSTNRFTLLDQPDLSVEFSDEDLEVLRDRGLFRTIRFHFLKSTPARVGKWANLSDLPAEDLREVLFRQTICDGIISALGNQRRSSEKDKLTLSDAKLTPLIAKLHSAWFECDVQAMTKDGRSGSKYLGKVLIKPAPSTARRWLRQYRACNFDPMALCKNYGRSGNRDSRLGNLEQKIVARFSKRYLSRLQPSKAELYREMDRFIFKLNKRLIRSGRRRVPAVAFKNANSSFFASKPFRLVLPDFGRLYELLDAYVDRHRSKLLNGARDPGTLFVKTVKVTSANAAYNQTTFYEAWKLTIQRYGIYNPYTGRGVIKGLLPHGPHNVRDVLATHILKQTGSYEQASYAIQDTPDMVQKHYGRFLPQDKAAIAAQILNRVWAA